MWRRRSLGKRVAATLTIVGVILGIVASAVAIVSFFGRPGSSTPTPSPNLATQPDTFSGNITQQSIADDLVAFLKSHDGRIVNLHVTCTENDNSLFGVGQNQSCNNISQKQLSCSFRNVVAIIAIRAEGNQLSYLLCFSSIATRAGEITISGDFSILMSGILGGTPQNAVDIFFKQSKVPASSHSTQPERFEGDITQQTETDALVPFLKTHNADTVWLNIVCTNPSWPHGSCSHPFNDPGKFCSRSGTDYLYIPILVRVSGDSFVYELCFDTHQANVEVDNGPYGAGVLVAKGYFSVLINSGPDGRPDITVPGVVPLALIGTDSLYTE
jgi:hypothetical protein